MANRLAAATSPYLLQHKDNPVDWWEWGEEAFAEATRRDVPVLLSVGYAACHWCHVMAHESFEDPVTAAELNAGFVCIKVDREERPDVDAVYMEATQALTGQGGWPMTVFLTPEGRAVYAGTYFPPQPRHGMPAFRQLLAAIHETWVERRDQVEDAGARIASQLADQGHPGAGAVPDAAALADAVRRLESGYDEEHGGFGGAPKFPPSMVLEWLLRHAARVTAPDGPGDPEGTGPIALDMAEMTFLSMAASGMYDQLEGGFARYSVDDEWVVPHFEKMLYDNGLLARAYLHWWRATGDPVGLRIAVETCDWMIARLGTAEGGLAASLDADTPGELGQPGVEGETYVWSPAELREVLGADDAAWVAEVCGVTPHGTFEGGRSTLRMLRDFDQHFPADRERWQRIRPILTSVRAQRRQPDRDDKVVAAWNGLAIAALAETGALAERPDLLEAARRTADLLLRLHVQPDGSLRRVSRDGVAGRPAGVLEDYANVAEGLLALYAVTAETRWYAAAVDLIQALVERFWDEPAGEFKDTPFDEVDPALTAALGGRGRARDTTDGATPSGTSAAASALLTYAALSGSGRHRELAERAVAGASGPAAWVPRMGGALLGVCEALLDGPREVAVVGPAGDSRRAQLQRAALAGTAPGLVVAVGEAGDAGGEPGGEPEGEQGGPELLSGRGLVDERPAAYPCRGMVCALPLTDPADLARWTGATLRPARTDGDASE